jgi:Fe-S cluster assembly protein SufD
MMQQEGESAYHTALMQVVLEAGSAFVSHSTSMGGKLARNDLQVLLGGEGAEATLNGLVYAHGDKHIDNHTLLMHEKGHCTSHELYKHVLADKAAAIFKGKIYVQKDAQKTDSKQTSKALLLSDTALMNSQPALEIYADDVKCTHGSTTGPVDANAVFYLISRGLSRAQARHLMTYAFAADITRRIRIAPVRARIEDYMAAQHGLPLDLRITEGAAADAALM